MYPGLTDRLVVVTGAASGQGAAEARLLALQGARVVATDVAADAPEDFADAGITYRRLDAGSAEDWKALAATLGEEVGRWGPVKGLINNAGVTHRARLGETELSDWDRVLSVNLTGPMLGMQAIAPLMGEGSSIVNTGSAAGLNGHYTAAYTTSKWGLRGLTHVAATELGPRGIRVNIIHPGFIETPMVAQAPQAMRDAQLEITPLERFGVPDNIAHMAVFLLSDAAAYISGAEIPVDGGAASSAGAKVLSDRIAAARAAEAAAAATSAAGA